MRANLNRGKLVPPASLSNAQRRLKQLGHEIARIKRQLNDDRNAISPEAYNAWYASASSVLRLFESEERQLKEWIDEQKHVLFKETYLLLKVLEADDVDFEPYEKALIRQLDEHFKIEPAT